MFQSEIKKFYNYLKKKDELGHKIIFFTTSNRWEGDKELPKSSMLSKHIKERLTNCEIIDISKLRIWPCEGNISINNGNNCSIKASLLKDDKKNPHKFIRCWASINNPKDEMYVVTNKIYEFGFKTPKELSFNRQWTNDSSNEYLSGYRQDYKDFLKEMNIVEKLKESLTDFNNWISRKINS